MVTNYATQLWIISLLRGGRCSSEAQATSADRKRPGESIGRNDAVPDRIRWRQAPRRGWAGEQVSQRKRVHRQLQQPKDHGSELGGCFNAGTAITKQGTSILQKNVEIIVARMNEQEKSSSSIREKNIHQKNEGD